MAATGERRLVRRRGPVDVDLRPPLRLASDARRFDTSPDWFSVAGAAPALEMIADIGVEAIHRHNVHLANRSARLWHGRLELGDREHRNRPGGAALAGPASSRPLEPGKVRLSFHLYNTEEDVESATSCLPS
jgi:selenocysteine lyase/cysteine desulfurase